MTSPTRGTSFSLNVDVRIETFEHVTISQYLIQISGNSKSYHLSAAVRTATEILKLNLSLLSLFDQHVLHNAQM